MKTQILKHKKLFAVISCLLILCMVTGVFTYYTFSKYSSTEEDENNITLEEFCAVARLYITDDDGTRTELPVHTNGKSEYFDISIEDFNKLSVDIDYKGNAKTYCRFKLDISWYHTVKDEDGNDCEELILHKYPEYICANNVYNNVEKDNWFYFTEVTEPAEGDEITYHAITQMTDKGDFNDPIYETDKSVNVRIYITVDCVQYNRAKALWKLDTLPWENDGGTI